MENLKKYIIKTGSIVLMSALISGLGFGVFKYAKAIDLFALEKVVVSGTSLIPNEQVLEYTDIDFGTSLFELPLDSIQREIAKNPFVLTAQASRQFPRSLFIEIHERKPIAYINHGEFSCVDQFGYVMPMPPAGMGLEIPILSGFTPEDTVKTGEFTENPKVKHMVEVLTDIRREYPRLYPEISELISNEQQGYTLYTAESATRVYLGMGELENKVHLLETFWETVGEKRTWADYEYIDLRYQKQIIVRERT
ncbi:MAG: FtsQ-type POTRA domain-containing protein [Candidatus Marinimicrobia bacterium]|nr:FtsQ-type POTRA domain-containing protein [Candidatus Neomarinimicrobiota bacterium]MCF7829629.1 FtsQ-type POTRA domain-containing protein [Candidatus Neomarinimicrobiota bacterium]MCF7879789.1 FtsQ-type POTRA domain-containing protein [Candidatus Neomarinimicrobiota bacterium]